MSRIFTGEVINGIELGEWLEDDGDRSRYAIGDECYGDSVWVCNNCECFADNCICEDDYDEPDEFQEWQDFDPDC